MKLVAWCVAGLVVLGGCGKKDEAPAANVQVSGGAQQVTAKAPEPAPTKVEAKAEAQPAGAGAVAAAEHEGCGGHAAAEAGREADCPFEHEHGGAAAAAAAGNGEGGCHAMAEGEPAKATADGKGKHLGAAFTVGESKPLASVVTTAAADAETLVRVEGTVEKVCQKKGCWMVVRDGEIEARVTMKDYAFFIPVDAAGQKAVIEGTLKVKVFTEAQAKHLAEDGNEDPAKVTGDKKEFLLTATGVQLGG